MKRKATPIPETLTVLDVQMIFLNIKERQKLGLLTELERDAFIKLIREYVAKNAWTIGYIEFQQLYTIIQDTKALLKLRL